MAAHPVLRWSALLVSALGNDETQWKLQPIRALYEASLAAGALETAIIVTSRVFMCTTFEVVAQNEQCGHPSSHAGSKMKW